MFSHIFYSHTASFPEAQGLTLPTCSWEASAPNYPYTDWSYPIIEAKVLYHGFSHINSLVTER